MPVSKKQPAVAGEQRNCEKIRFHFSVSVLCKVLTEIVSCIKNTYIV